VLDAVSLRRGDRVAVLGDGRLGLLICAAVATTGADVLAVGHHPTHIALAERWGARGVLAGALTERATFDVVVEATGSPAGLVAAIDLVRPRGVLVLKSTFAERPAIDLAPLVINEITVVGSRCGPFGRALDALASGLLDPRPLIEAVFPLSRAEEAFSRAGGKGTLKILVEGRR
jgi:threonine dehydrogenase-like Zn-dependent dehydrogenase